MGFNIFDPTGLINKTTGIFDKGSTTVDPLSRFTPEQRQSLEILMQLGNTGSGGGINLGQAYGGSLGNYDQTAIEGQGQNLLSQLLSGGGQNPYQAQAGKTFTDFTNTQFNPDDPSSGFAAFSRQVGKQTKSADDVLNRESAINGSRFGTGIQQRKGELASNQSDALQSELARLFQNAQSNKLAGAQGLAGLGGQQFNQQNQLLNQSQDFGALQRNLLNQEAQAQYGDFQRQQNEKIQRIGILKDNTANSYGAYEEKTPSLFSQLLAPALGAAGTYFGGAAGGKAGYAAGSAIGQGINGSSGMPSNNKYFNSQNSDIYNLFGGY